MGASIQVNSAINEGSEFSFTIVFKKSPVLEIKNIEDKENNLEGNFLKNHKMAIVDDNKINLFLTKKMLENKGALVDVFEDPIKAIEKIKTNFYDLILMDIHMPSIDGYETTQIIRKFNKSTPIIALTAASLEDNEEQAFKVGMNGFVNKPYKLEHFFKVILNVIGNR